MTKRAILWGAAVSALLPAVTVGCGSQDSSPPASGTSDVISVAFGVATTGSLPQCTSALAGTVAHVASPPSLSRCSSGKWSQISCDTSGGGTVAYASSPPTLWACVHSQWTEVGLPDAGPPGPRGPAGPPGEAGITPTITVTTEPAGTNCAAGGIRVDVDSDGSQSTSYVCNGVSPADESGLLAYPAQHAQAFCEGVSKCCPQYDAGPFDLASCEAQWTIGGWDNTTLPLTASVYDAGHLTFNATQAAACTTALYGFTCTGGGQYTAAEYAAITNACLGVLGGTIPVGAGGCISSWECVSGAWCNFAPDAGVAAEAGAGTGVCTALLSIGASCTLDEMCSYVGTQKPTTYCNLLGSDGGVSSAGTCQAAKADSTPCGDLNQGSYFDDQACASQLCGDTFTCGTAVTIPTPMNFCSGYPYPDAGAD